MDSSTPTRSFMASKTLSSRRTSSFSSSLSSFSSCSSSFFPDDQSSDSPATPLRFTGIPFSWEQSPGIPKKQQNHHIAKNTSPERIILPLPPPSSSKRFDPKELGICKKVSTPNDWRDPFFAALVECSKDDHDLHRRHTMTLWNNDGPKVSRSVSERFGFGNLHTSCKRSCNVSQSIIYVPRSSMTSYDRINRGRSNGFTTNSR